MAEQRDSAVTAYIRLRIREWEASGEDQLALARKAHVSPATISQVKTRSGVGSRSIAGFAAAFGFPTVDALRSAAYQWSISQEAMGASLMDEPGVASAVQTVLGLRPGITRVQIETILHGFSHERFRGRDETYWVPTLLAELQMERRTHEAAVNDRKTGERDRRAHKSAVQGAFRAGHRLRNSPPTVPPPADAALARSRKKHAG